MIERNNKFVRIRVIGGSRIFDSIMNILKKPIVSKLLASAGKSAASALGERLVNRMIAPAILPPQPVALPQTLPPVLQQALPPALPMVAPATAVTQQPQVVSSRAQELISKYSARQSGTGLTMRATPKVSQGGAGAITIQEYVKSHKGAGIKLI